MIWNPLTGQAYHGRWGNAVSRVSEARARGMNRRVKFWIGVRVLFDARSTERCSSVGEGVFADGVQEPPGASRFIEGSSLATTVLGPVAVTDCPDTRSVACLGMFSTTETAWTC